MSIYAQFDNGEQRQFASNKGWGDVVRWSETIGEEFQAIKHLAQHGYEIELEQLEAEIAQAIQSSPPAEDVRRTLEGLVDALAIRGDGDTLFVTDGMGPDDGKEEDGEPPQQFDDQQPRDPDGKFAAKAAYGGKVSSKLAKMAPRVRAKALKQDIEENGMGDDILEVAADYVGNFDAVQSRLYAMADRMSDDELPDDWEDQISDAMIEWAKGAIRAHLEGDEQFDETFERIHPRNDDGSFATKDQLVQRGRSVLKEIPGVNIKGMMRQLGVDEKTAEEILDEVKRPAKPADDKPEAKAEWPEFMKDAGIKDAKAAHKKGLTRVQEKAPEIAKQVISKAKNWVWGSTDSAQKYLATEIVKKTVMLGGLPSALRSLGNDYERRATGANEPNQAERFRATAQGLVEAAIAISNPDADDEQFDEQKPAQTAPQIAAKSRIEEIRQRTANLAKRIRDPQNLFDHIVAELRQMLPLLGADLSAAMYGAHLGGYAGVIGEASALSGVAPPITPPPPADLVGLLFPEGPPPGVRLPALADAIDTIRKSPLAAGADFRQTAELVRQGAFAVTGDLTEQAVDDLRQTLARTLERGGTVDDFTAEVRSRFEDGGPLSKNHLETVFRTQTAAAQSNGQDAAIKQPMVADAFPYRAYYATTDRRVREQHIAMEKGGLNGTNIYRADDPTWNKFRPPWDFNCRCAWSPVSVEQAARRGVTEARDWWQRAQAMAKELGGDAYEMLPRTVPFQVAHVTPPPFAPPAEFERR